MAIVELVLQGMALAERRLIALTMQRMDAVRSAEADDLGSVADAAVFNRYIGLLVDRPDHFEHAAFVQPANIESLPTELDVLDQYGRLIRGTIVSTREPTTYVLLPEDIESAISIYSDIDSD